MPTKLVSQVAIIGIGAVGGAAAFALILSSIASELLVVDIDTKIRDGQVRDLSDVAFSTNSPTHVRAATHHEAGQCDIIVITAGSKCTIGQTKLERVYRNISIIKNVTNAMKPMRQDAIIVVVSNPVDLLTSLVLETSGLPKCQVLGSGTLLDSMRLRGILASKMGVAAKSLDIFVLGVQGESEVVAWSTATIGGVSIDKSVGPDRDIRPDQIERDCKDRSRSIIQAKGAISFGIGSIVSGICSSILADKRNVVPISSFQPQYGCCFSWPAVLGRNGVVRAMDVPLSDDEEVKIVETAKSLKEMVDHSCSVE